MNAGAWLLLFWNAGMSTFPVSPIPCPYIPRRKDQAETGPKIRKDVRESGFRTRKDKCV